MSDEKKEGRGVRMCPGFLQDSVTGARVACSLPELHGGMCRFLTDPVSVTMTPSAKAEPTRHEGKALR